VRLKGIFSTSIAIATGLIVLAGYFLALPLLINLRVVILNWAVILAAFAVWIGVVNLFAVHAQKFRQKKAGRFYSLVLVVSMLVTLIIGLVTGPQSKLMTGVFNMVQLPIEASLMAVLAVSLTYASARLLRRVDMLSILFLGTAMLVLLGTAPLPFIGEIPLLSDLIRPFIAQVLAAAGARGILIGVALGILTTGLRILFGVDRPYGGK